ncbi:hypothetical protein PoB_004608000 [Plakobranchus ocellatus]|uniref:Uncharacterized protein n=1 Tax=Plakobranchus ocellatus TaxID=259542 RepID=A0AAV4BKJ5_9GAST|nr:hypothetical protein PoB_004608000 [Plakobranchus ocellatus]
MALPYKDSGVKMAAARNTLRRPQVESAWRPPILFQSLSGGRRIDSVYAKTTLAQERITKPKKVSYRYCSWHGEMAFTIDEFEDFFQRKSYPSSRYYDNLREEKIFRRAAAKFYSWNTILHRLVKHGN